MRPTTNAATFFAADQNWQFRVRSWDTPQTVLENNGSEDVGSSGMRLRVYEPISETSDWGAYASALKAVAANASPEAAFTDAGIATATVADGRWPLVAAYWGSGTPNWWGGSKTSRVAVAYSGTLVPAAQREWLGASNEFTFALAGSGWARIDKVEGATRTTLFQGELTETRYLTEGFFYSNTSTFAAGATLHIYYVQTTANQWGGLVVKALSGARPSSLPANAAGTYFYLENYGSVEAKERARVAPAVGCGLFSHGSAVNPVELPFIVDVSVTEGVGAATRADITIPLVNPANNDGNGWVFYQSDPAVDPGVLRVYEDGALLHTLRRKRLLQVEVARRDVTPEWVPIFTGHVDDFSSGSNGKLTIQGISFEGRLVEQYEQVPDRISYMARGFQVLDYSETSPESRKEPVYNVPAFDNWPLAWAVEELALRAGVDPSRFRKPLEVVLASGAGAAVTEPSAVSTRFQAVSLSGEPVRLPRPVHYGNVGLSFTETRPFDDPYVFRVEPTKDLWARTRELTDRLGYVCRYDAAGAAVLYPSSSPAYAVELGAADVVSGSVAEVVNPSAYGARYVTVASSQAAVLTTDVYGSRIDVSFPRVVNARAWTVTVAPYEGGDPVAQMQVVPGGTRAVPELFFESPITAAGANQTVHTVFSGDYGRYTVTLTAAAHANVAYVDCVLVYLQDPNRPLLPTFSTGDAAEDVATRSQQDEIRNKVTIVGRRKAAATDSDKFAEAQTPTEQEFVVQNAVDVHSVTDPSAENYVGYLKQSVIYDESVTDDGLARYLAQVFIYRQSVPHAGTNVTHSLLPMLELGDPVAVEESKYQTVAASAVQYVLKVTHKIGLHRFQSMIETAPWPDYPAYQPRTDIDLSVFNNEPVVGFDIAYTTLSGHAVTNPTRSDVKELTVGEGGVFTNVVRQSELSVSGGALQLSSALAWPPVPGTFQAVPVYGGTSTSLTPVQSRVISINGNLKAHQRAGTFDMGSDWVISTVTATMRQEVENPLDPHSGTKLVTTVPFKSVSTTGYFYYDIVDNRLTVYRGTRHLGYVHSGTATLQYQVSTADLRSDWLANNPYHRYFDIDYKDTPTVARVQVPWEQLTGLGMDSQMEKFSVRYLSLFPDTTNTDPNGIVASTNYSPFYDPYTSELGNLVSVRFSVLAEGLYRVSIRNWEDDTVVAWLTNPASDSLEPEQHWEYLPVMANKQYAWDGVDQLGLWNSAQSVLYSELVDSVFDDGRKPRVGRGFYCWNRELNGGSLGSLAYVWMKRYPNNYADVSKRGMPIIGHGTFAAWYVHVEAQTSGAAKTEVSSKKEDPTLSRAILTHLPEPTKLELKVHDWNGTAWVAPATSVAIGALGAYVNNDRPVRIRFGVAERPGALWEGNQNKVSVKLTREVHLRSVIADQTVVFRGTEIPESQVEDRAIYNRRLVNDQHTKQYIDTGYRRADTFKWVDGDTGEAVTEWVFRPSDFKRDFRISGYEEEIAFGDYLQLEEVPQWNGARGVTAARSRLQLALMSYLFYLSAYVTDRSGRSNWGINRQGFIDKSKIFTNTRYADWPTDPMYEHRRTVVCRQWTGEAAWKAEQLATFGYGSNTLFAKLLETFWWQHDIKATTVGATGAVSWSQFNLPTDPYSSAHVSGVAEHKLPAVYGTARRQLGSMSGTNPVCLLGQTTAGESSSGNWNWETGPVWIPSVTRDFHPYFLLPPMLSPPRPNSGATHAGLERDFRKTNCYYTVARDGSTTVTVRTNPTNTAQFKTVDAGAAETWSSPVMDYTGDVTRFWPGRQLDIKEAPFKDYKAASLSTQAKWLNYVRQDEMVHYEDLRGVYSRSKYPVGQSVKVAPGGPYYLNPFRYTGVEVGETLNESSYPLFHLLVEEMLPGLSVEWFRIAFRSEYLWESGSLFPTTRNGRERLDGLLWWRHRLVSPDSLYYDYGAWVGWKDDDHVSSPPVVRGGRRITDMSTTPAVFGNPFTTKHMPVGTGPVLPQTVELVSHLVLVPSRQGS